MNSNLLGDRSESMETSSVNVAVEYRELEDSHGANGHKQIALPARRARTFSSATAACCN
jgi:hypothetical protein